MGEGKRSHLGRLLGGTVVHTLRVVGYGVAGALLMFITIAVIMLERRPDLAPWHSVHLDEEFTADDGLASFDEYLALEERLFRQLDEEVFAVVPTEPQALANRYQRGSMSDPHQWTPDWNRTFQIDAPEARAGVLLLHGMSDAPYSMRSLGQALHARGATVLGMRVPGHGTAPSGLVHVEWEDMAAAVELAMHHLSRAVGDRTLYVVGYSNGGALAVLYALSALQDASLPSVDGIVLISPEIGITKLAVFAAWQERLGRVLGLDKLDWNSIKPEYDPFQYKSFALNAGKQAHELTGAIQKRITQLGKTGDLQRFPRLLAFQSVVDATVSARALVTGLFDRLPAGDHELVLFDLNRVAAIEQILKSDPRREVVELFDRQTLDFTVTLLTNASDTSSRVVLRQRSRGATASTETGLDLVWPEELYSLAHIALPFPPDDPVYGSVRVPDEAHIQIGELVLRGEHGVLQIPAADILRVHWNPFYSYLQDRTEAFMQLGTPPNASVDAP